MTIFVALKESLKLIYYRPKMHKSLDYDRYWLEKRQSGIGSITEFQKSRADWTLSRLSSDSTILDVGSGDGGILNYFRDKRSFARIIATDISQYALDFLKSRNFEAKYLNFNDQSSVNDIPTVDHVIAFEILEHLHNPEEVLEKLRSKAKVSVVFSIPNTGYFAHRLRLLFGKFPLQWRIQPGEHLRFWTLSDLKWWLSEMGYKNSSSIHLYAGIPILNKIWPSLFAMGMIVEIKN